jgi:4-hydroxy-3-methylbut-2-enyl diphosphate reductase
MLTAAWLPAKNPLKILVTSGASCPDALVESVINKLVGYFPVTKNVAQLLEEFSGC